MWTSTLWLTCLLVTFWSARGQSVDSTAEIVTATNTFSLDLLKDVLKREQGNVVISPISVSTLLAMVQQGARNNSLVELSKILHMDKEGSKTGYKTVLENFTKRKYKSKLEIANKVFVNPDFDLEPAYQSVLHTTFNTAAEKVDFNKPQDAAHRINQWVSYQTKSRIPELIKVTSISGRTQMILVNTIYFKGVWKTIFPVDQTSDEDFHVSATKTIKVPTMKLKNLIRAGKDAVLKAEWIELPFDGDDFSLVVVLPTEPQGLSGVVEKLTVQHLTNMLNTRQTKEVSVKLPRFKMSGEIPVVASLRELGLNEVFDTRSNLEGISTSKGPLTISNIIHKADIEVNEAGSEAAAASGIVVNTLSVKPEYEKVDFFANRPFLAIIVDRINAMPLFIARVQNPTVT